MTRPSNAGFKLLAVIGVGIVLATLVLHGLIEYTQPDRPHEFLYVPLLAGFVLAWYGSYWQDPKRAREGGDLAVGYVERMASIVWKRGGRRESDVVVPVAKPDHAEDVEA